MDASSLHDDESLTGRYDGVMFDVGTQWMNASREIAPFPTAWIHACVSESQI